jgi:hypothetical protein
VSEYDFELRLAARLEDSGLPGETLPTEALIARQLGTSVFGAGDRVMDLIGIAPGSEFDRRTAIADQTIPPTAIESAVSVGTARPVTEVIDGPPSVARDVAERAADVGFFECVRRDGRLYARQATRYPDWFGPIVGIENKPDLGTPGDLAAQLRRDVSLQVLDAVVLATATHVTGAHRNRLPDSVGIWRVDSEGPSIEVLRDPEPLEPERPSFEIRAERPGQFDVEPVDSGAKARQRRRIAERAYGKGWRTYEPPSCANHDPATVAGAAGLPHCDWADRLVDPARECGPDCPGHEPAPAPDLDLAAERDRRTPWERDVAGAASRQAFLDRFDG